MPGSAVGSLRQAILDANQSPGSTITFNIPGTGPFAISTLTALPTISVGTTINGGDPAGLQRDADRRARGSGELINGLTLGSGSNGSTIEGLDIVDYGGAGIDVEGSADLIAGNYLGRSQSGSAPGRAISSAF